MASSLLIVWSSVLFAAANPQLVTVEGEVGDIVARRTPAGTELWASTSHDGRRRLKRIHAVPGAAAVETRAVPRGAVFVDACPLPRDASMTAAALPVDALHFVDESGVVTDEGRRIVAARPLMSVADPASLFVADLCPRVLAGELRIPVPAGILIRAPDGTTTTLPFDHRARAFSGRVHRGLRPARTYAAAVSVYAPRLFDVDVDGNGTLDFVVAHEERVVVFARRADRRLDPQPWVTIDLIDTLGLQTAEEQDLRVLVDDVDGDRRADMLIGVSTGALPERSATFMLASKDAPFAAKTKLVEGSGLVAPVSIVTRSLEPRVLFSEIDTSMMSLGAVLLSGSVDVKTALRAPTGARTSGPTLAAAVDVRRARMVGALPVADVDLDGDGISDLLDLGIPGRAFIYRGTAEGYESRPIVDLSVPVFTHVVSLPLERSIVLVGAPSGRGTRRSTKVAIVHGVHDGDRSALEESRGSDVGLRR